MLKTMHRTLSNWIKELEEETEITTSNVVNDEARLNMVSFGITENQLNEWGRESVNEFLKNCSNIYRQKSKEKKLIFYAWLDEQASQIRISAVSEIHNKPPFGCPLNAISLDQFIKNLFENKSGLYTKGVLDVWCKNI